MNIIDLGTRDAGSDLFLTFINQLCETLEMDFASYATVNPVTGAVQGYANYPDSWKDHYMSRNLHRVDPTLHRAGLSIAPVDWKRLESDPKFRTVFRAAGDFGIKPQGISVPIRGPYGDRGLLNVTRDCSPQEWELLKGRSMGNLQTAAVHLHDAVMRMNGVIGAMGVGPLSSREREVLQWAAAGKLQQEIGDILSISYRTVEVHLRSAREKLGVLTTIQAVGRAIGMGLIYPQ